MRHQTDELIIFVPLTLRLKQQAAGLFDAAMTAITGSTGWPPILVSNVYNPRGPVLRLQPGPAARHPLVALPAARPWICWSPFVGMLITGIPKGRTVTESVLGVILIPILPSFVRMSVFGGSTPSLPSHGVAETAATVRRDRGAAGPVQREGGGSRPEDELVRGRRRRQQRGRAGALRLIGRVA